MPIPALDLVPATFNGTPLDLNNDVLADDEEPPCRRAAPANPILPPAAVRQMRIEREHDPGGAGLRLAACDIT